MIELDSTGGKGGLRFYQQKQFINFEASSQKQSFLNQFIFSHDNRLSHLAAFDLVEEILYRLNFSYHIDPSDRSNIPRSGPTLLIVNTPSNFIEILGLIQALYEIRHDVKLVSSDLPFCDSRMTKFVIENNKRGWDWAGAHLESGGLLVIYTQHLQKRLLDQNDSHLTELLRNLSPSL